MPVAHLGQLHRELDVRQPAVPEPKWNRRASAGFHAFLLHPHPHPADLGYPLQRQELWVGEVGSGHGQPPAEHLVPRHRPGLEQRLELPRLAPPLPVLEVGSQQAGHPALGTEVGVRLEPSIA